MLQRRWNACFVVPNGDCLPQNKQKQTHLQRPDVMCSCLIARVGNLHSSRFAPQDIQPGLPTGRQHRLLVPRSDGTHATVQVAYLWLTISMLVNPIVLEYQESFTSFFVSIRELSPYIFSETVLVEVCSSYTIIKIIKSPPSLILL